MLIVISPAKTLDFESELPTETYTTPDFLAESEYLINKLQKFSPRKIGSMMSISPALADLNFQRFQEWHPDFTPDNARQALLAFTGQVYLGIEANRFSQPDFDFAQDHLRILSGLYGLLRPLDLIQPYRLEMGTKWAVTPKKTSLYKYWDKQITHAVNTAMAAQGDDVLINLASNEYFKAIQPKSVNGTIISPVFMDMTKSGEYKSLMTYAKFARGYMTRYIIKNKLTNPEDVKGFDLEGYTYNDRLTEGNSWVFTRG